MNRLPHIPKEYQYKFYLYGIPKNRSYGKWAKSSAPKELKDFIKVSGYSREKALEAMRVLTSEQIKDILKPNKKRA